MSSSTITVGNNDGGGINSFGDLFKGVYLVYMVVGLAVLAVLALVNVLFRYMRSKVPNNPRTRRGHDRDQSRRQHERAERRLLVTIMNSLTRNITNMTITRGGGTTVQESNCATSPVNSPPMSPVQDNVRMDSMIPNPIPPGVVQTVSIKRENLESNSNLV